jgi:hypothetical protein
MNRHYAMNNRELPKKKEKHESTDLDIEEARNTWFSIVTDQGVHVSGPVLKSTSEESAKKLGHNNFKATDGWLSQWKCRFGIKFKKAYSKNDSAEQCKSTKLPNLNKKFCTDDIYNVAETGLFYHAMLDGSLSYKDTSLSDSKKTMDHVCCTVQTCQEMINGSCWLLGKGPSLGALRGLVWTVYQLCIMPTKMCG